DALRSASPLSSLQFMFPRITCRDTSSSPGPSQMMFGGQSDRKNLMSFDSLGLRAELLRAIADEGYSTPTAIQSQAIPAVIKGRHILAAAQTGTGKTAGFTLPLLEKPSQNNTPVNGRRPVRALILTPTRELAAQ